MPKTPAPPDDREPGPGWCWDGKFNLMAAFEGLSYPDLLRMIIDAAQTRLTVQLAEDWASPSAKMRATA